MIDALEILSTVTNIILENTKGLKFRDAKEADELTQWYSNSFLSNAEKLEGLETTLIIVAGSLSRNINKYAHKHKVDDLISKKWAIQKGLGSTQVVDDRLNLRLIVAYNGDMGEYQYSFDILYDIP